MLPGGEAAEGMNEMLTIRKTLVLMDAAVVLTAMHESWSCCRWRFTRKWQAEQMKQFEPPPPPGANGGQGEDEEEWTAALRLLDTADGGLNMQIGRTLSLHNSSMMGGSSMSVDQMDQSLNLMSPGLTQCVLLDGSIKEVSGWCRATPACWLEPFLTHLFVDKHSEPRRLHCLLVATEPAARRG
jgi:hypothetical protein